MIINNNNKKELEKFYIHDALFTGYTYDYSNRRISFSMNYEWLHKRYNFVFNNVVFFSGQSCLLWGGGSNVYCIYIRDELPELERIKSFGSENSYNSLAMFNDAINYIGFEMILNSGDTMLIICESFDIDAVELD